jgi:hypothetical protein
VGVRDRARGGDRWLAPPSRLKTWAAARVKSGGEPRVPSSMPRRRVGFHHEPELGNFYYGRSHPMKPHRVRLAYNLIVAYQLDKKQMFQHLPTGRLTTAEMTKFHSDECAFPPPHIAHLSPPAPIRPRE